MDRKVTWTDTLQIALGLMERHPGADPMSVTFSQLERWVRELPAFADDSAAADPVLEAIQLAWFDEVS